MKTQIALIFLTGSLSIQAESIFKTEAGSYELNARSISKHFSNNDINYVQIDETALANKLYRLNDRDEFQIKDWFLQDWNWLQKQALLDIDAYNYKFGAVDFNRAKINFYKELNFNLDSHLHEKPVSFPREWGGLNHPPIKEKIQNIALFDQNFAKPIINDSLYEPSLQSELDEISGTELSFNNKLEILEDHHSFDKKLSLIKSANFTIFMSSLVFVCDSSTKTLTEALIEKAKKGVRVYVMADSFISKIMGLKECLKLMDKNGIEVMWANDFFRYEGRTVYHSKKLIVDLKKAIIGGHNMIDADNLSNGTDFRNRDLDILIEGPMVHDITLGFLTDWEHFHQKRYRPRFFPSRIKAYEKQDLSAYKKETETRIIEDRASGLRGQANYEAVLNDSKARSNGVCRFVQQSPFKNRTSIGKTYLKLLDKTRFHLGVMDPGKIDTVYQDGESKPMLVKLDTYDMFNALHARMFDLAKNHNVIFDYLTTSINMAGNEHIDDLHRQIREKLKEGNISKANRLLKRIDWWNNFFGIDLYKNLIKDFGPVPNIHVWSNITFMHSKVFTFDRIVSSVGSYNFNHNSTDHSYENTVICMDQKLNSALDEIFVRDMANSIPLRYKKLTGKEANTF